MHINEPLIALALAIVAALAAGMLLKRLRQPALVGYLLTGIILGPSVLAVVESRDNITFLADLGILLLLFVVGMELSLRGFRGIWKIAIATAALQIAAACAIMWMVSFAFGWSTGTAIVFGFVVSLSSTAVVIKLLEDLNLLRTQVGQLTIGVLIAQDLAIIPMLLILGMISGGADISYGESGAKIVLSLLLLAGLVIFLSRREKISLPFSSALVASVELCPLYGTAICFGAAGIAGLLGLSTVYGAFLAGLIVGNSRSRRVIFQSVQQLQNLLVMAAATVLPHVPASKRGIAGGIIFTGVGLGIALSGTLVPALIHIGVTETWAGLGVISLVMTIAAWRYWPMTESQSITQPATSARRSAFSPAFSSLYVVYTLAAVGMVAHMVFLVDYAARELNLGIAVGSGYWIIFGIGAALGPIAAGRIADKIGFRPTLRIFLIVQSLAVALTVMNSSHLSLSISSFLVGAMVPGIVPLIVGRAHQLSGSDGGLQRSAWSYATIGFSVGQAGAAYAFSYIFEITGHYHVLFQTGAAALALAFVIVMLTPNPKEQT